MSGFEEGFPYTDDFDESDEWREREALEREESIED